MFFGKYLGVRLLDYFTEHVLAIWESLLLKLIQDKECWVFYTAITNFRDINVITSFYNIFFQILYLPSDIACIFYYLQIMRPNNH